MTKKEKLTSIAPNDWWLYFLISSRLTLIASTPLGLTRLPIVILSVVEGWRSVGDCHPLRRGGVAEG